MSNAVYKLPVFVYQEAHQPVQQFLLEEFTFEELPLLRSTFEWQGGIFRVFKIESYPGVFRPKLIGVFEASGNLKFIRDAFQPYEHITGAKKFLSFKAARTELLQNFSQWFPLENKSNHVFIYPEDEKGNGHLTVRTQTEKGMTSTNIFFQDFRPIKRISDGEAKIDMCPR
jgi:hypothetical protein